MAKRSKLLRERLQDSDPTERAFAAEALASSADPRAVSWLGSALADRDSEVRFRSAEALGLLLSGKSRVPLALLAATRDRTELVRIAAVEAIGRARVASARPVLWAALSDRSPLVRRFAAIAIGQFASPRDTEKLIRRMRTERSSTAKTGYYEALYRLGRREYLEKMLELVNHRDYRIRCAVANSVADLALSSAGRRAVLPVFRKALRTETTAAARSSLRSAIRAVSP